MKCKYCNGTGEHINDANRMTTCEFCDGTGVIKSLTNEEWIHTLNTEQLAEFITDIVYECKEQDDCMDCKLGWCSCNYVAKWLKENHEPLKNDEK